MSYEAGQVSKKMQKTATTTALEESEDWDAVDIATKPANNTNN